jgi:hypothetical protein
MEVSMLTTRRAGIGAAVVLTVALVLALTSSALAAASSGAQVNDTSLCIPSGSYTVCQSVHTVVNTTSTPSGYVSTIDNATGSMTISGPGCDQTRTATQVRHLLVEGQSFPAHEFYFSLRQTQSFDCNGTQVDCTSLIQNHYVDGVFQFARQEASCTGVPV